MQRFNGRLSNLSRIDGALRDAAGEMVRQASSVGGKAAREASSGRYSLSRLAEMDHPYARRHGVARLDPATINVQTGRFLRGWREGAIMMTRRGAKGRVFNQTDRARWMFGTRLMVERPVWLPIEAAVDRYLGSDAVEAIVADAIRKALT